MNILTTTPQNSHSQTLVRATLTNPISNHYGFLFDEMYVRTNQVN